MFYLFIFADTAALNSNHRTMTKSILFSVRVSPPKADVWYSWMHLWFGWKFQAHSDVECALYDDYLLLRDDAGVQCTNLLSSIRPHREMDSMIYL